MQYLMNMARKVRASVRIVRLYPRHTIAVFSMLGLMVAATCYYANQPLPAALAPTPAPAAILSEKDRMLSESVFDAQDAGNYALADQLIGELDNQVLVGHMLAQRYLDPKYDAIRDEVVAWLANYGDHPEAARMRALAQRKGASTEMLASIRVADEAPLKGSGYVDHLGRRTMPDSFYRGLARWKEGAPAAALQNFANALQEKKLSDWQKAQAAYWAYRAANKTGNDKYARDYLTYAGQFPTTFYGQLANRQLGRRNALVAAMPYVPESIRSHPSVIRAEALASVNQRPLAEAELRQLTLQLGESQRPALVSIAGELGLANLQVRLGGLNKLSAQEKIFANYPMPSWLITAQTKVDPALMLSIARQESAFRRDARSTMGATGMMQMMPATARHVERTLDAQNITLASADTSIPLSKQLDDPAVNIHLGAQYISILAKQPMVKHDLIHLIAAYNAGPGSVQNWAALAKNTTDPLLYIESIPYPETRNYVMQVIAHQWVYQTLMGQPTYSLDAISRGQWPQVQG